MTELETLRRRVKSQRFVLGKLEKRNNELLNMVRDAHALPVRRVLMDIAANGRMCPEHTTPWNMGQQAQKALDDISEKFERHSPLVRW